MPMCVGGGEASSRVVTGGATSSQVVSTSQVTVPNMNWPGPLGCLPSRKLRKESL